MNAQIGKYRVIASLASGSQGTVYRAHDPTTGRDVALKVLHPHLATPDAVARFRREGWIVASISHPNIAGISEIGEHNGSHFIAIEYVPHAASELIGRGAMDVAHAASIAHQTALALEAARVSRHGITHHDVKPDNLLLTSLDAGGMVKLIDFGIAHAEGMASMTQAGAQWGTPFYMPPEQWAGERGDTRSDVYSLGVVMYQTLAGRAPFDSDAENALSRQKAIADQHLVAAPASLRSVREDVPEELDAVVAKCMAKSPSERYQTPGELANTLAGMFGLAAPSASVAASRPPVQAIPEPPSLGARRPSSPSPRPRRPPRQATPIFKRLPRNRAPLLAAVAFGTLIVIFAVVVIASRPEDGQPPLPPRIVAVAPPETPTTMAATEHFPMPTPTAPTAAIATPSPQPTAAPANTPAPTAPAQAAPAGSPADIFQSAANAMNALSAYRAEMEHILNADMMGMSGEIKTEVNADVQVPGKMGGDMIITLAGEPPITNGFVIIGDDAYVGVADPGNPQNIFWGQSAPSDIAPLTTFLTWFETGSDYEFSPSEPAATEDLNGEETRRLRGSFTVKNLPAGVEQPENMEADVWIGTSDNLIRKIAAAGGVEEAGLELEIAITYSRFDDAAIQVEAPSDFIAAP